MMKITKKERIGFVLNFFAVVFGLFPNFSARAQSDANLQVVDGVKVVSLYGSWHQMGRQYGSLLSPELNHVWSEGIGGRLNDRARAIADSVFIHYPFRFKQFVQGASETSGLSLDQLVAVNAIEYIDWVMHCSGIALWGSRAADGALLYGRSYDAGAFHALARDIVVTVFHPSDGSLACATVGYAGELYCVNGVNAAGLFLELNSGAPSMGFAQDYRRLSGTMMLLDLLLNADNLDYVDAFFRTIASSASFIIGVADSSEARSYEWCSQGSHRAPVLREMMVQTNHCVSPEWNLCQPADSASWLSPMRRCNLVRWADGQSAPVGESAMQHILQLPIGEGGVWSAATEYQLVYAPSTFRLSLFVVGDDRWHTLDLSAFLR